MRHADVPTEPRPWPAPPPLTPTARQRPTGTAAGVVGIVGSIVGAVAFAVVWSISNITLNTSRYGGFDGTVDVGRARLKLSAITYQTRTFREARLANAPAMSGIAAQNAVATDSPRRQLGGRRPRPVAAVHLSRPRRSMGSWSGHQ